MTVRLFPYLSIRTSSPFCRRQKKKFLSWTWLQHHLNPFNSTKIIFTWSGWAHVQQNDTEGSCVQAVRLSCTLWLTCLVYLLLLRRLSNINRRDTGTKIIRSYVHEKSRKWESNMRVFSMIRKTRKSYTLVEIKQK